MLGSKSRLCLDPTPKYIFPEPQWRAVGLTRKPITPPKLPRMRCSSSMIVSCDHGFDLFDYSSDIETVYENVFPYICLRSFKLDIQFGLEVGFICIRLRHRMARS
jgi:hypothetical protein